jgi:hypothetical protein
MHKGCERMSRQSRALMLVQQELYSEQLIVNKKLQCKVQKHRESACKLSCTLINGGFIVALSAGVHRASTQATFNSIELNAICRGTVVVSEKMYRFLENLKLPVNAREITFRIGSFVIEHIAPNYTAITYLIYLNKERSVRMKAGEMIRFIMGIREVVISFRTSYTHAQQFFSGFGKIDMSIENIVGIVYH